MFHVLFRGCHVKHRRMRFDWDALAGGFFPPPWQPDAKVGVEMWGIIPHRIHGTNSMDVSKNRDGPPKWMVKIMENPMNKWDDLVGPPIFLETPIFTYIWLKSMIFM